MNVRNRALETSFRNYNCMEMKPFYSLRLRIKTHRDGL